MEFLKLQLRKRLGLGLIHDLNILQNHSLDFFRLVNQVHINQMLHQKLTRFDILLCPRLQVIQERQQVFFFQDWTLFYVSGQDVALLVLLLSHTCGCWHCVGTGLAWDWDLTIHVFVLSVAECMDLTAQSFLVFLYLEKSRVFLVVKVLVFKEQVFAQTALEF